MSQDELPVELTPMDRADLLKRIGVGVVVAGVVAPAFSSSAFAKTMRSSRANRSDPSRPNSSGNSSSGPSGRISAFVIRIPAGISSGKRLRVRCS